MMHSSAATHDQVPQDWCLRRSEYPRMATVPELFAEQAERTPEAIAVVEGGEELDYRELDRRSNRVARELLRSGLQREDAVAIVMRRSAAMVVAMLGVLKAGGTYVPLDENAPAARLRMILEDASVRIALTDDVNQARLEGMPATAISLARLLTDVAQGEEAGLPNCAGDPLGRAYVMYTSGSTGTPKGVEVVHRGIVRLVRNTNYVEFSPADVVGQVANPAFDAITFEVWGALLNGARLVILDTETVLSPRAFAQAIQVQGITTMFLTSSLFSVLAATVPDAFGAMRTLVVGGDAVNPDAARTVLALAPPARLVNGYGPTECTTFSVCHWIRSVLPEAKSIPIGSPICNSEAYILDDDLQPLPAGEAGDLYLGGDGLARGYLNRPELNRERFLPHPFDQEPGARLYKTGDRARYLADGTIEFLGRRDHQVKFHGFRIELGEIECALRRHPDVIDAVVMVIRSSAHDERLAGYVAARAPESLSENGLRRFLGDALPNYMIPSHLVVLAELPLNAVGKVDRARLPQPGTLKPQRSSAAANLNSLEEQIAGIWKDVLSLPAVGLEDSFFDVGGTSLTLALVAHRLAADLARPIETTLLFQYPTVRTLAGFLNGTKEQQIAGALSDAQQRALRQKAAFRGRPLNTGSGKRPV